LASWLSRGLRRVGVSVLSVLCTFIFGPGGPQLAGGNSSGAAFSRALTNAYGAQLQLPAFFEGSFTQAFQAARQQLKLLVIYLHSENSRYTQGFCSEVLGNEFVRSMLDENFIVWGGDVVRMESSRVAQMIRARQCAGPFSMIWFTTWWPWLWQHSLTMPTDKTSSMSFWVRELSSCSTPCKITNTHPKIINVQEITTLPLRMCAEALPLRQATEISITC